MLSDPDTTIDHVSGTRVVAVEAAVVAELAAARRAECVATARTLRARTLPAEQPRITEPRHGLLERRPHVVVIGGGVSAAGDKLLDPARAALQRTLVGASHRVVPELVAAQLGPRAGMVGAALLVTQPRR